MACIRRRKASNSLLHLPPLPPPRITIAVISRENAARDDPRKMIALTFPNHSFPTLSPTAAEKIHNAGIENALLLSLFGKEVMFTQKHSPHILIIG